MMCCSKYAPAAASFPTISKAATKVLRQASRKHQNTSFVSQGCNCVYCFAPFDLANS